MAVYRADGRGHGAVGAGLPDRRAEHGAQEQLGAATSTVQFSRSIGGTLGVSIMGAFLTSRLASLLVSAGIAPGSISLDSLLDPVASASTSLTLEGPLRAALGVAVANLFIIALVAAVAGLLAVLAAPRGRISDHINFATENITGKYLCHREHK